MKDRLPIVILAVFLIFGFTVQSMAGTTLGGSLEKNFTDDTAWYGGYLRTGGLFKLELGGSRPFSSSSSEMKLFSYFLADLNLGSIGITNGSLHLYFGASPDMTLDSSAPSFSVSNSSAYGKMGLQLNLFPFSIQLQSTGRFDFSGNLTNLLGGLGVGLTF
ncbi:hypothetical protein K9M78_03955 [Candidatus Bipolaricaulota bacterium]|nr:hypothetical protein [Candidatus Bipolaricaulota bacterium]